MGKTHDVTTSSGLSIGGTAKARIVRNLAMTPEADEFLADLAQRTGLSEGDVLRLALGMFKTAIDAKATGEACRRRQHAGRARYRTGRILSAYADGRTC